MIKAASEEPKVLFQLLLLTYLTTVQASVSTQTLSRSPRTMIIATPRHLLLPPGLFDLANILPCFQP
jgi:hypothetical protein